MLSVGSSVFYRPKDKAVHADVAKLNFARGGGGTHTICMYVCMHLTCIYLIEEVYVCNSVVYVCMYVCMYV